SRIPCGKCDRELRVQRGTRIVKLLMVLRFRSSYLSLPRVLTNFGIGPLADETRQIPSPEEVDPISVITAPRAREADWHARPAGSVFTPLTVWVKSGCPCPWTRLSSPHVRFVPEPDATHYFGPGCIPLALITVA